MVFVPGTLEYRLLVTQIVVAAVAFVLLVANKLPMKWAENFYKFSNYLFFGWMVVGGTINWVITGNIVFIISYLFPYIAIPMFTASVMYAYKNWREIKQMKQCGSGEISVSARGPNGQG